MSQGKHAADCKYDDVIDDNVNYRHVYDENENENGQKVRTHLYVLKARTVSVTAPRIISMLYETEHYFKQGDRTESRQAIYHFTHLLRIYKNFAFLRIKPEFL